MLSVICPVRNEARYIRECLESILAQDFPREEMEVLFVDGMSTDKTREIVMNFASQFPFIRLVDNPRQTVPCAMNIGIRSSKGNIILRLDAHAKYADNYFSVLVNRCLELKADNVGAVCRTEVLTKNPQSLAICEALSNPFGVGNSVFRIGVDEIRQVDTVPFGCFPRAAFEKYGLYDERLTRNQDFELNRRITDGGGKIYIVPNTYSIYFARDTLSALWRQNYRNGLWGIRTVVFTGRTDSLALRHYIPMIFVLSIILPIVGSLFWRPSIYIAFVSLAAYLAAIFAVSITAARQKHLNLFWLIAAFATLHVSNGVGMLVSLLTTSHYVKKVNKTLQQKYFSK